VSDGIIKITLRDEVLGFMGPILDRSREENRYEGVLCTIARTYKPQKGVTVLELQIRQVPRHKFLRLLKFLTEIDQPKQNE
jgi:hypothetical protein